ncbi:MAG: hypothetical protein ACRDJC_12815 [Thermomicrobiales bacterium]
MTRQDIAWQGAETAGWYLESVRGAIPFAQEQLAIMLQIVAQGREPVTRFLDVGAGDGALTAVMLARYPQADAGRRAGPIGGCRGAARAGGSRSGHSRLA